VAYLVTTSDRAADEVQSSIWLVSWDGTQDVQLVKPSANVGSPHWTPDARSITYLGKSSGDGRPQVLLVNRNGGKAHAITHVDHPIESYALSPDGKRIALVLEFDNDAPLDPKRADEPRPIVIDSLYFKEDGTGYIGRGQKNRLFLYDIASSKLDCLSTDMQANDTMPAWSPDSTKLAFAHTHERGEDPDGMMDIDTIEAREGAPMRRLVRVQNPNFQHLTWSPDGKSVAYLQGREAKYYIYLHDELALVAADGSSPHALTGAIDRAIYSYQFTADGSAMTLTIEDDGSQYPAQLRLADGALERLIAKPLVVTGQSTAAGHLAMVASDDTTAADVYAFENGVLRKLTHHAEKLMNEIELGASEDFSFKVSDGTEIHGMLVKPPAFVAGRKYPTILWIHGGPDLQDEHSLDFASSYQLLRQQIAANGYVVVGINYRGSSGRGFDFANAIFADWGHKEVEDLLAGMDVLVARGLADPDRLGIGGWSYGGILTDATIAREGRFKAAFSGAGTGNMLGSYGTDQYVLWYNAELGPPWKDPELWMKMSYPLFHADHIHTPTLFMGGDRDFNVPITGSEQMYVALRTLGVPAELVVYPDQHHEIERPSFYLDRLERTAAWFGKYLRPAH
jgi:dipeptidyl aminopeptidase/acylaminoacyl peptidase